MKFSFKKSSLTKNSVAAALATIFSVTMGVILLRSVTNTVPSAHASSAPSLPMPSYTSPVPAPRNLSSSSKKSTTGQAMTRLQKRVTKSSSSSSSSSRSKISSSSRSSSSKSSVKKRPARKAIFKKISTKKS